MSKQCPWCGKELKKVFDWGDGVFRCKECGHEVQDDPPPRRAEKPNA